MVISGVVASIRWSYYQAAAINGYEIQQDKETREWTATGNIVAADAFKLSQSPLRFIVPFKGGHWEFVIRDPVPRRAGPFAIRLGKPIHHADPHPQAGNRTP